MIVTYNCQNIFIVQAAILKKMARCNNTVVDHQIEGSNPASVVYNEEKDGAEN